MRRSMAYIGCVLIAGLVSVASSLFLSLPVLVAQHGADQGGSDHGGASGNAIVARADAGVISLESMRFT